MLHLTVWDALGTVQAHLVDVVRQADGPSQVVRIFSGPLDIDDYDGVWTNLAIQQVLARLCDDLRPDRTF